MLYMLAIYLLLAGLGLSFWHSYRSIKRAQVPGVPVNVILAGRREKGLLMLGGSAALAYGLTIVFLSIFWGFLTPWIVLVPFVYLLAWSVPRLFLPSLD